jgi:N-acyl-D-amino-acid deacylase
MYDILIRGGTVVDGTGAEPRRADVAVSGDRIVAVGSEIQGEALETIDATGLTVTPGFIDVHTHYDGQVFWDPSLELSAAHGVTTVFLGNCGVGFAPVHRGGEKSLIEIMEGVEDVPARTLELGVPFSWETFADFLDELGRRQWAVDVAALVAYGPVREYAMGEAGARNEPAAGADIEAIASVVRESIEAGAFGLSVNRAAGHTSRAGRPVPGTYANYAELRALTDAVMKGGGRLLELAPPRISGNVNEMSPLHELPVWAQLSRDTQLPVTFLALQNRADPTMWRRLLDLAEAENKAGAQLVPQIAARPFGMLVGFPGINPFQLRPTFHRLSKLPLKEMLEQVQRPAIRQTILGEEDVPNLGDGVTTRWVNTVLNNLDAIFPLEEGLDYEPPAQKSIKVIAAASGKDPLEVVYDLCLADKGRAQLLFPMFNYADGDHQALYDQLQMPGSLLGLADGGAHATMICDASQPTTVLAHWVRDRTRGPRLSLGVAVKKLTREVADFTGLTDRGVVEVGKRADLNLIDMKALRLHMPYAIDDLPGGGRRLVQGASGYKATIVAGTVTRRDDRPTGALPGRLVRRTS